MKEAAARTVDCNPITDTGNIEQINLSAVRVTSTLTLTEMVKHVEKKRNLVVMSVLKVIQLWNHEIYYRNIV